MKRKNNLAAPLLALLFFAIACNCNFSDWVKNGEPQNSANENSAITNNSETNSADEFNVNLSPGSAERTGIPECDEFIDHIVQNSEETTKDSMIARGIVEYYKQIIFSKMREGMANSTPQEKQEFAKQCREGLKQIKEQSRKSANK